MKEEELKDLFLLLSLGLQAGCQVALLFSPDSLQENSLE